MHVPQPLYLGAQASSSLVYATPQDESRPLAPATAQPKPDEAQFDPDDVGPPPPPAKEEEREDDGEPEFDASEDELEEAQFPISHELLLKDHTKVVSALTLDPSGARILSGSHDYDCKLWDFGGMDWRCKPFKTWEPAASYYVRTSPIRSGRTGS